MRIKPTLKSRIKYVGPVMRLPKNKQKELKEKGKRDAPPLPYCGAMGRLRDFEQQRGIADTNLSNPAVHEKQKRTISFVSSAAALTIRLKRLRISGVFMIDRFSCARSLPNTSIECSAPHILVGENTLHQVVTLGCIKPTEFSFAYGLLRNVSSKGRGFGMGGPISSSDWRTALLGLPTRF